MTAVLARSPLASLSMMAANNRAATTTTSTRRRRSARAAAFEEDEEEGRAGKRAKVSAEGPAGAVKRANGGAGERKGGKAAYDENDDGFQFTRRTSRRTTKTQTVAAEPAHVDAAKPALARRKKSVAPAEHEQSAPQKRRRSARLSGDKEDLDLVDAPTEDTAKTLPKRTKKSAEAEQERRRQRTPAPQMPSAPSGLQTPKHGELHVPKKRDGATKIMLPFADTPVITRNKEMRKKDGHRRSSTGLRGRRASSLIDSGLSNALPHPEVQVRDYYKYIEQSLPEPRRMKQLLTWCGSRALPEKPTGDVKNANAIMAARAIQQELIDDFANKPELSDWFSREDTAPEPATMRPNPQNEKNRAMLQELQDEISRLEEEKSAWEALASASTGAHPPSETPSHEQILAPDLASIDTALLQPSQAAILSTLLQPPSHPPAASSRRQQKPDSASEAPPFAYTTPLTLTAHLTALTSSLEPTLDLLADGVHRIAQYRATAERVADRVLGHAVETLERRDREGREKVGSEGVGTGDLLRGLAGVLSE